MKKFYILFILLSSSSFSQILNPGFEIVSDTTPTLPGNWKCKLKPDYFWEINNQNPHSGKNSLLLMNVANKDSSAFSPFTQVCDIDIKTVKKIYLTAYIKTENVSQNAGLWCQLWDSTKKQIGFQSLETQNTIIRGTTNWRKYTVMLIMNPEIKHLLLGGFLNGTGKAWYDDFAIEEITPENLPTISKKAKKYLNNAIKITKTQALYKDSIDWLLTEKEIYNLAFGAQETKDCYPAVNYLISVLRQKGDNHSHFYPPIQNVKNKIQNLDGRQPTGKYLGNSVGYIEVPGFMSINQKICTEFATKIQSIIKKIDSANHVQNWIVDLRENTGGNMYPMIAGLGPILGEDTLGYFNSLTESKPHVWKYKNGASMLEQRVLCKVEKPYYLRNSKINVIVLIGPNTGSSGEMTAISFIGKENTFLIGQPTAGYSTGNASHELSDGAVLNLASSYCTDRNHNKIIGQIQPQEKIEFYLSSDGDNVIEYAKKKFLEMK